jgi:nitroreductase
LPRCRVPALPVQPKEFPAHARIFLRGLDTCPQAAFADFHRIIRPLLNIPEKEIIVCGMALGHIDPDAPVNALVTERAPISDFTIFEGL